MYVLDESNYGGCLFIVSISDYFAARDKCIDTKQFTLFIQASGVSRLLLK